MVNASGRSLVGHWPQAAEKGLLNPATARAISTACRSVLEVQDDWENLDVRTLDVDRSVLIFKNLRGTSLTPRSLRDYESRFRRAVASYLQFLDDPSKWQFPSRTSSTRRQNRSAQTAAPGQSRGEDQPETQNREPLASGNLQEYAYPFRQDVLARLAIPRDATSVEISRLVAWAQTLAIDYEPSS